MRIYFTTLFLMRKRARACATNATTLSVDKEKRMHAWHLLPSRVRTLILLINTRQARHDITGLNGGAQSLRWGDM